LLFKPSDFNTVKVVDVSYLLRVLDLGQAEKFSIELPLFPSLNFLRVGLAPSRMHARHVTTESLSRLKMLITFMAVLTDNLAFNRIRLLRHIDDLSLFSLDRFSPNRLTASVLLERLCQLLKGTPILVSDELLNHLIIFLLRRLVILVGVVAHLRQDLGRLIIWEMAIGSLNKESMLRGLVLCPLFKLSCSRAWLLFSPELVHRLIISERSYWILLRKARSRYYLNLGQGFFSSFLYVLIALVNHYNSRNNLFF
jgi:hypothetical protein